MPNAEAPLDLTEAGLLFAPLLNYPSLVVGVSGGPDSVALLWLLHQWRQNQTQGPSLIVATVDHGLRPESAREAAQVAAFAGQLGLPHETLMWQGEKPKTGIQEQARAAREALLLDCARRHDASAIVLAHHLDDQAETVLMRLAAGSGIAGLAGMTADEPIPGTGIIKLRPLLSVSKARLVATCMTEGLPFVNDPSNWNNGFARPRLRTQRKGLEREGLTPQRLSTLARRAAQADAALDDYATQALAGRFGPLVQQWPEQGEIVLDAGCFGALPQAVRLRILAQAIAARQSEGCAELAQMERMESWLYGMKKGRRTLAGVLVSVTAGQIRLETAPLRRNRRG